MENTERKQKKTTKIVKGGVNEK